ncbi:hypothetical protein COUCH_29870 [Couchioplanes caeruleus]|uniref:hypothetical protein n=1 Tax=Couchioplanes caeruleus TaxID=56438 RepID=UPI0020BFCD48|nr:hypothetical protein [Couchioplanes caeruleus]UQU63193.1 hypothetical protein COUCH_29870 [Couchioplanes caeruleus]
MPRKRKRRESDGEVSSFRREGPDDDTGGGAPLREPRRPKPKDSSGAAAAVLDYQDA